VLTAWDKKDENLREEIGPENFGILHKVSDMELFDF
jgi:hypothetical protein